MTRGMMKSWFRDLGMLAAAFAFGWWADGTRVVRAAGEPLQFQLQGLDTSNALLVYQPEKRAIYIYRSVMTGNSALQCSYRLQLEDPGGVIRRELCPSQALHP